MEECSERVPLSSTFSARKQQWRCSAGVGRQPQLKESFWQCFDPFVQLADEYVTFCDTVFSGLIRLVLRIMDTITTSRSPIEILSNAFASLPSLFFSFVTSIVYALFYVLTLPFRILFYTIFYHPFASFIVFLLIVSAVFAVMVFVRRLSVAHLCRVLWRTLAPYAYVCLRALVLLLFPQLSVVFNTLQLLFSPLIGFFSLILCLPVRLARRRSVRAAPRRREAVIPPEDSGDESTRGGETTNGRCVRKRTQRCYGAGRIVEVDRFDGRTSECDYGIAADPKLMR
uniref:RING-type domain-containing protein n=1 Tax=Parascaris univalens TaxID=6257 RepID=A0A915AW60_PARUN